MAPSGSTLPALPRTRLGRLLVGRPRLLLSIVAAMATYAVIVLAGPGDTPRATALLVAWNAGAVLYIALNAVAIARATSHSIRWRARITDEGRFAILVLVALAALASMGATFVELGQIKALHGLGKALHVALAAGTILSAWVLIHLVFALHYAHEYFDEAPGDGGGGDDGAGRFGVRGGLRFPAPDGGSEEPDYLDFLYFSFIIGVAAQTADVEITSRAIRRTSLGHSVLSFVFNSAILALTINIAAGLV